METTQETNTNSNTEVKKMKNIVRKGFPVIDFIFVMIFLVVVIVIIMPSMSNYNKEEKQTLAQMKFDLEEAMYKITKDYINKKDFSLVIPSNEVSEKAIEGTDTYIYKDLELQLFNGNMIDIKLVKNEGSCTNKIEGDNFVGNGYEIKIYNTQIPNKAYKFNSCNDNKIELIDIK